MKPRRRAISCALVCVLLFTTAVFLNTRHNQFPYYYHPDEPSKVSQLVTGKRNYRHPPLLLNTTQIVLDVATEGPTKQEAAIIGRWVSATFAALAVVVLALLGYHQKGLVGAIGVGVVVALNPHLITYGHFLKEDTALILGLACFLLSASLYSRTPSLRNVSILGAACGLAVSGKYTGVLVFIAAIGFTLCNQRQRRLPHQLRRLRAFLAGFAVIFLLVNYPVFQDVATFSDGVTYEAHHAMTGGAKEVTPHLLTPKYLRILLRTSTWSYPVAFLAAGYFVFVFATWRRRDAMERLLVLFPIGFFVLLQGFPLKSERHLLPVIVSFYVWAGMALASIASSMQRFRFVKPLAALGLIFVVVFFQAQEVARHLSEFSTDSRDRLRVLVNSLPAGAKILQGRYGGLPDSGAKKITETDPRLPHEVVSVPLGRIFELGTLQELRASGITHVAVSSRYYNRYLWPGRRYPSQEVRRRYERGRAFYESLFRQGQLLWESSEHSYIKGAPVNPPLRLYSIEGVGRGKAHSAGPHG